MTDKKIVLLTYDRPHRKTQDVAQRLHAHGFTNVTVVAQEWIERKQMRMLYPQRPGDMGWPENPTPVGPGKQYFGAYGWDYMTTPAKELGETLRAIPVVDAVVIGGMGLLSEDVTDRYKIVNSHPGYLPFSRGLDTVKWAFLYDLPIGVTTHLIDERADAGRLIHQVRVPLLEGDDFTRFALRLYNTEMEMLTPALMAALSANKADFPEIDVEGFPAYRRMGRMKERGMIEEFARILESKGQPGDRLMMFVSPPSPWGSLA